MQDILDQLITPEVRMVLYLMLACVVMLYVLSIVYVIRDAQRRGAEPWWLWAIISVIPIVGLLAYVILRPSSYLVDREEQDLHRPARAPAVALRHLPQVRHADRQGLHRLPDLQHAGAQRLPDVPPTAQRGLEGLPVLPHAHPVARVRRGSEPRGIDEVWPVTNVAGFFVHRLRDAMPPRTAQRPFGPLSARGPVTSPCPARRRRHFVVNLCKHYSAKGRVHVPSARTSRIGRHRLVTYGHANPDYLGVCPPRLARP